jgi:hypothetical protein
MKLQVGGNDRHVSSMREIRSAEKCFRVLHLEVLIVITATTILATISFPTMIDDPE